MRETTILKPHTWLNLTCLGCFMLPTTAYESNLGSQVARKFVSHRPTWLSCLLMEEGNIKNLQFIFYIFLYENRRPIIFALLEKYCSIFSFLRKAVVEELENSAHSHRRAIWAFNRKHEAYGERGFTNGPVIIRTFRLERKGRNL